MVKKQVSIVIPTYNRAECLIQTLDSLRAQSHTNWEAYVVDDHSTDDTDSVMTAQCADDERIHYMRRAGTQKGAPACRNQGFHASQGEYVIFLDSDDLLHPTCLEARVALMEANRTLDFSVYPAALFVEVPGDLRTMWNAFTEADDLERFLLLDAPWQTTGPFWRRSFLDEAQLEWDELAPSWQDWEFHIRALLATRQYARVNFPDHFVRRPGNDGGAISANESRPDHILGRKRLFLEISGLILGQDRPSSQYLACLRSATHKNNLVLTCHLGLLSEALSAWRESYRLGLIGAFQFYKGMAGYRLHALPGGRKLASRFIGEYWFDYGLSERLRAARRVLAEDRDYWEDPKAFSESLPEGVVVSRSGH